MKRYTRFLILVLLSYSTLAFGADAYQVNDELYIWAKSGMNLRVGPSTKADVYETLPYGTKVTILETTDISYTVTGIKGHEGDEYMQKTDPIFFKGNWVKVKVEDGEIGYMIDQYLLKFKPRKRIEELEWELNLKKLQVDTLYKSTTEIVGEGLYCKTESFYEGGFRKVEEMGGVWGGDTYHLPAVTLEEALVLFSASYQNYKDFWVYRNWKEEIILEAEMCEYVFTQKDGFVEVKTMCGC